MVDENQDSANSDRLMDGLPDKVINTDASPEGLGELDLSDLREYRDACRAEEEKVSYWRRIAHIRLDLIKAQKNEGQPMSARDLMRALGDTGSGFRRQQLLSVESHDELPALPGLDNLWTSTVDFSDKEGTANLVEALEDAEKRLSSYRKHLHARIDRATDELITRYRTDPTLSETLLPNP